MQAVPITRKDLDLRALEAIPRVLDQSRPDAIINCAAYTNVDKAESDEAIATRINSAAVGVMAQWAAEHSRPFLTFSSDYVFSGDASAPYLESSPTDPVNAYGRSKLTGERLVLEAGGLVVRTSWLISGSHPNFVATIIRLARERNLRVVNDQHGCPTVSTDLALTSFEALELGMTGLLHITNQGQTTWYELARAAVAEAGLDPETVMPCSTAEYPSAAKRPAYSVLGSERIDNSGLTVPPHWRDSLPAAIAEVET